MFPRSKGRQYFKVGNEIRQKVRENMLVQRFSTWLVIKEMQLKTTKIHVCPRMAKIQKTDTPNAGPLEFSYTLLV